MRPNRSIPLLILLCASTVAMRPRGVPTLKLETRVDWVDVAGREPIAVEHPGGSLFVAAYGLPPHPTLWTSSDRGKRWRRVDVGSEVDGAVGNSDVALAVAPDGTLYFANLLFDRGKLEGVQVSIGVSADVGRTWHWSVLSKERFSDRPWVAVGGDGLAHVVWSDGKGVHHASSADRGVRWVEGPLVAPTGGSSHLAVSADGKLAVRVTPLFAGGLKSAAGVDRVAVSSNGGGSWQSLPAPGQRTWDADDDAFPPRWVEPIAWDAGGALYSFWTNAEGLWLARSVNRGETWTSWKLAASEQPAYYPYLAGGRRNELAASWFTGRDESLRLHVGRIELNTGERPRLVLSEPILLDSWSRTLPRQRDTAGEYAAITFLRQGGFAVVAPLFNPTEQRLGFTWLRFGKR